MIACSNLFTESSQEIFFAVEGPFCRSPEARVWFVRTFVIAFARDWGSRGGVMRQFTFGLAYSRTPRESVMTTGVPQAIASSGGRPNDSHQDADTKTSEDAYRRASSRLGGR